MLFQLVPKNLTVGLHAETESLARIVISVSDEPRDQEANERVSSCQPPRSDCEPNPEPWDAVCGNNGHTDLSTRS